MCNSVAFSTTTLLPSFKTSLSTQKETWYPSAVPPSPSLPQPPAITRLLSAVCCPSLWISLCRTVHINGITQSTAPRVWFLPLWLLNEWHLSAEKQLGKDAGGHLLCLLKTTVLRVWRGWICAIQTPAGHCLRPSSERKAHACRCDTSSP